jgi:hypothetical protein
MSMSWSQHVKAAEEIMDQATQDFPTAQTQNEFQRLQIAVAMAQVHALLAETKRVRV